MNLNKHPSHETLDLIRKIKMFDFDQSPNEPCVYEGVKIKW
jgi:hypothetical protein